MKATFAFFALAALSVSASPIEKRDPIPGPGPVCLPPTYGCGTTLFPKCCYPTDDGSNEKRDPIPGPGPVCLPPTYGCGTKFAPKCCEPPPEDKEKRQVTRACPPGETQCGFQPNGLDRCCIITAGPCGSTLLPAGCYCVNNFEYSCEP